MAMMRTSFVVCVRNDGYPASLQLGRVYEQRPDKVAGQDGFVRIVDESGEDYLYPKRMFARVTVAKAERPAVKRAVAHAH
jgi:hypothetical protein